MFKIMQKHGNEYPIERTDWGKFFLAEDAILFLQKQFLSRDAYSPMRITHQVTNRSTLKKYLPMFPEGVYFVHDNGDWN